MHASEIQSLERYLKKKFGTQNLRLIVRKETGDSVEVFLGDEFVGLIYRNEEEGEVSYDFTMSILDIDLAA